MSDQRLGQQMAFLEEIGKLKLVYRRSRLLHQPDRFENDAEHSWHQAMMVQILGELAEPGTDLSRVTRMLLIHDLVEIYAGDTFSYDEVASLDKEARELLAADKLYSLLPPDQGQELRQLWDEFEARQTAAARFAAALDRLQPIIQNYRAEGASWRQHAVRAEQVIDRCQVIAESSPALWLEAAAIIRHATELGWLVGGQADLTRMDAISEAAGVAGSTASVYATAQDESQPAQASRAAQKEN